MREHAHLIFRREDFIADSDGKTGFDAILYSLGIDEDWHPLIQEIGVDVKMQTAFDSMGVEIPMGKL